MDSEKEKLLNYINDNISEIKEEIVYNDIKNQVRKEEKQRQISLLESIVDSLNHINKPFKI